MVSGLFGTARELPRLREISVVLVRHGLGDLLRRAGVAPLLETAGFVLQWVEDPGLAQLEMPQRARLAFEQLGPTFVKLGQILSTREDLLPPAWTSEMAQLHSHVAPVAFEQLLPQVEKHVIADAGHWLQQEKPDEVNALLVPWLQRNFG